MFLPIWSHLLVSNCATVHGLLRCKKYVFESKKEECSSPSAKAKVVSLLALPFPGFGTANRG